MCPHRNRAPAGDFVAGRDEAVLAEHLRGDPARRPAQLGQSLGRLGANPREQGSHLLRVVGPLGAGQGQLQAHEALLGAVADVSFEAAHRVRFGRLRRRETRSVLVLSRHGAKWADRGVDEERQGARLSHRECPHHPGQEDEEDDAERDVGHVVGECRVRQP